MSNTETVVGITEELQPCPSTEVVYAWGEAEDEPETDDLPSGVSYLQADDRGYRTGSGCTGDSRSSGRGGPRNADAG